MKDITYIHITIKMEMKYEPYLVDGIYYHPDFPLEWAKDHKKLLSNLKNNEYYEDSGPKGCVNCKTYGLRKETVNGKKQDVFYGYCSNCIHNYEKNGYCRSGIKINANVNEMYDCEIKIHYPYIKTLPKLSSEECNEIVRKRQNIIDDMEFVFDPKFHSKVIYEKMKENIFLEKEKMEFEKEKLSSNYQNMFSNECRMILDEQKYFFHIN